jgi:hypothetical protein
LYGHPYKRWVARVPEEFNYLSWKGKPPHNMIQELELEVIRPARGGDTTWMVRAVVEAARTNTLDMMIPLIFPP